MKYAINCLGMLMLAFVLTFCFQADVAHANEDGNLTNVCNITLNRQCEQTINTGETLKVKFNNDRNGGTLSLTAQNMSFTNPATISSKIGYNPEEEFPLQPTEFVSQEYLIGDSRRATFTNNAPTTGVQVRLKVALQRPPEHECNVTVETPCHVTINTGETLKVRFDNDRNGGILSLTAQNLSLTDTTISPKIGSQQQEQFNLQPDQLESRQYPLRDSRTATVKVTSASQGSQVRFLVSLWR